MGIKCKPDIVVDDILIEFDSNSEANVDKILNQWGSSIPMVKVGDYVLKVTELISFNVTVGVNQLPTFYLQIDDTFLHIRNQLKAEIDKCIIFIGYKTWYIKFTGLITQIHSDSGSLSISVSGVFFQEPLYISNQKIWKEKTINDILTEICTECKLGLFSFDSQTLLEPIETIINPNKNNLETIKTLVSRYTDCIFSFDTYGFLHIGDIETMLKQEIDKYSISWKDGSQIEETPMILKSPKFIGENSFEEDSNQNKITIESYTIDTNFSIAQLANAQKYTVFGDTQNRNIKSFETIGIGQSTDNTFDDFLIHKNPRFKERINKLLCGNLIKLKLRNILFELVPFSVVGLELWLPTNYDTGEKPKLDEEHSGKHLVIGYSFDYNRTGSEQNNFITQSILLI